MIKKRISKHPLLSMILFFMLFFMPLHQLEANEYQLSPNSSPITATDKESVTVFPIVGTRVSSSFGPRMHPVIKKRRHHQGLDLAAPHEARVRAIKDGRVIYADPHGGYGNLVVIEHPNGTTSHYGHLNAIYAKPGQKVSAGMIIGEVGSTGRVTGPHLHFEIRKNGKPINPMTLFPSIAAPGEG